VLNIKIELFLENLIFNTSTKISICFFSTVNLNWD